MNEVTQIKLDTLISHCVDSIKRDEDKDLRSLFDSIAPADSYRFIQGLTAS